jgi:hypothetical protein
MRRSKQTMDKLFIVVPQPPTGDISATDTWRDALHELQSLQATQASRIWIAGNVALLSSKKDEDLVKQIAVYLQNKNVKHALYFAVECPQQFLDFYHQAL